MADLKIEQDGLCYCIELARAGSGERMEALLRLDTDGWYVEEVTRGNRAFWVRIGRRKHWQLALAFALSLIENELIKREGR